MKKQIIELRFLSDRFLKWVKINFTLTSIILIPIIILSGFVPLSNLRAQPLDSYCLSKASVKPSLVKPYIERQVYPLKQPKITFDVQGQQYQVTPSSQSILNCRVQFF